MGRVKSKHGTGDKRKFWCCLDGDCDNQEHHYYMYVGRVIREHRLKLRLSMQDITDGLGISIMAMSYYETARLKIPLVTARDLAIFLNIDPKELFG